MNIEFKIVNENWKKNIWNKKFRRAYSGKLRAYGNSAKRHMFNENSKYITISKNGNECGFARIRDVSKCVKTFFTKEIWCIEEIFVEEEFRHLGLAKELIRYLRENHKAYMIYMQKHRAERLVDFHESIGFSEIIPHHTYVDMVHVGYNPFFSIDQALASNDNEIEEHKKSA